jgi:hypothetical protein
VAYRRSLHDRYQVSSMMRIVALKRQEPIRTESHAVGTKRLLLLSVLALWFMNFAAASDLDVIIEFRSVPFYEFSNFDCLHFLFPVFRAANSCRDPYMCSPSTFPFRNAANVSIPSWYQQDNTTYCSWEGLACNANGRITIIDMCAANF